MRELHLFAGIGGGILGGMLLGHTPVGAVELDPYCRSVLLDKQRSGILPAFPVLEDVRAFDGRAWRGQVDVVCGGFPCQPWSTAGKRRGAEDPRHLWPEMARIVEEVQPDYVFCENVSIEAFREPWRDLRAMGYRVPPAIQISAGDLGFAHRRNRWWLLAAADPHRMRQPVRAEHAEVGATPAARHADGTGLAERQGLAGHARPQQPSPERTAWRVSSSRLRRLLPGPAARLDQKQQRIAAAGNCQIPQVAAEAFRYLLGAMK